MSRKGTRYAITAKNRPSAKCGGYFLHIWQGVQLSTISDKSGIAQEYTERKERSRIQTFIPELVQMVLEKITVHGLGHFSGFSMIFMDNQ